MQGNERADLLALKASVAGIITRAKEDNTKTTYEHKNIDETAWLSVELSVVSVGGRIRFKELIRRVYYN